MYRHIDRAASDVQAHEPLSADVQAATLMSLWALAVRGVARIAPSQLRIVTIRHGLNVFVIILPCFVGHYG